MFRNMTRLGLAIALGFGLGTPLASAAPAGMAVGAASTAPLAAPAPLEEVNHHRWRGGGGASIEFRFGGGPRYYGGRNWGPPRGYYRRHVPRYHAPRYRNPVASHVRWCSSRYKSYRAWDNTFQPYNGPRRQCRSP